MKERQEIYVPENILQEQQAHLGLLRQTWAEEFREEKGRPPRYHIVTYGCQMNERDSEHLSGYFRGAGFAEGQYEEADFLIFNTCCIREHAEHKVFGNVGALLKRKESQPELMIAVCGCMMQQESAAEALYKRFPFVDLVFGTHALHLFPELLARVLLEKERVLDVRQSDGIIAENLPVHRKAGASAFVTVMYGCNNFCTFCIVPFVRGRERSRSAENILADIEGLAGEGVSEITLLGQNVNSYGTDLSEGQGVDFAGLLRRAAEIPGIQRLRFMTSHPKDLSPSLVRALAETPEICKHIHLPVQSGNDRILKRMNRVYSRAHYLSLLAQLREEAPEIEVTTDIIVGFPGETEGDFQDTLSLVEEAAFASAFTFMYSPRAGTGAARMEEQIPLEEKKRRLHLLNERQNAITIRGNEKYIGSKRRVLIDGVDPKTNMTFGKTSTFKTVYFSCDDPVIGQYVPVHIDGARLSSLTGRAVDQREDAV